MAKKKSSASVELLDRLARWQRERLTEDAIFLADEMPNVLSDVALIKASFFALREKVALLEEDVEGYKHRQVLLDFDDEQKH
ncbi:hypothetical protein SAMN02745127_01611 [Oceanospirillum multiglobuliferum]|uniref:Uncharacterized protein n=1 Tax=Oceanospirillum multiglobuliferum TaxID=64969 RepID=A0A1T4PTH7_9GAMM|nr:hypothetical protein [Oceanospirillum multiglobuliferum]OPX55332.1 hypothetical protein BTE48_09200 [Oceanospirillum multiglobuliferum]SJZ94601.1 hypothetical protein SAMN02745127_01611 [Oceanospirillum multiglobuliferum]